jgi:two-component system sensor histidine kinase UhpB
VIRVRDSERQHLARELHDEIGQNLAALRINMQLLRGAASSTRIDDSIAIIDKILDEIRDLSLSLRPPLLNEAGITAALRSYFEEQSARSGLSIDFVSTADGTSIPAEIASALFRIAQEAMTNAIRHSEAKLVLVSLDHAEDQIRLIVQDNGIGINSDFREEADDRPKLGLQGIQERTALLGGEFTLRSKPGAGTSVCIQVPFKSAV